MLLLAGCWGLMFRMRSWNVGFETLNDLRKRDVLESFLRDWRCDLIFLQETKLEIVSLSVVRSLGGHFSIGFVFLKTVGASRGIIVM